jgi:hypothetical protein
LATAIATTVRRPNSGHAYRLDRRDWDQPTIIHTRGINVLEDKH